MNGDTRSRGHRAAVPANRSSGGMAAEGISSLGSPRRRGQELSEQEMPPELGGGRARGWQSTKGLRMPQHGSRLAPCPLCRKEAD